MSMYYKPPIENNKPQYVPIVIKNKDYLAGYLHGINIFKDIIGDFLKDNGMLVDFRGLDFNIDSTRFNNVLENGKRENELTQQELKEYYSNLIKNKIMKFSNNHPENVNVFDEYIMTVECPSCGLGIYSFTGCKDIPNKNFKCQVCGHLLIDYTDHYDEEIEYDKGVKNENN